LLALFLAIAGARAQDLPDPSELDTGGFAVPQIWQGDTVRDDRLRGVVGLRVATQNGRGTSDAFCSGTLIDPSWVLTAGHCVPPAEKAEAKGYRVEIVVGTSEPYADRAVVDRMIMLPGYDPDLPPASGHDLALYHLASPVVAADPLPISRVHLDDGWAGLPVTVVGYGRTSSSTSDTGTKRGADLVFVRDEGDVALLTSGRVKWSAKLGSYDVVGSDGTSNACNGDSGGASVVALPDGSYVLVGTTVVVYGDCEGGSTGATTLDGYLDWIRSYVPDVEVVDDPLRGEVDLVELVAGETVTSGSASNASSGGCDSTSGAASAGAALLALAALVSRLRRP
jgi:secreted trypsin-like serine protease